MLRPWATAKAAATRGGICRHPDVLRVLKATGRRKVMGVVEFDPDEIAAKVLRCNERRAGAAERVKHDPTGLAERPDQRPQSFVWLLLGMKAIAGLNGNLGTRESENRSAGSTRKQLRSKSVIASSRISWEVRGRSIRQ